MVSLKFHSELADKARLKYETEKTYLTLHKSLFENPDKAKANERKNRVPIVYACTQLLDEKYADLIFYMEQPTNGSSGKKNPKSNKTLEKTEL
ncbi:MAG: hypothetical protein M9962_07290 [Oligoflexia bacterium]|nr:hypothetical protein [Oligoflexia bacterium]